MALRESERRCECVCVCEKDRGQDDIGYRGIVICYCFDEWMGQTSQILLFIDE